MLLHFSCSVDNYDETLKYFDDSSSSLESDQDQKIHLPTGFFLHHSKDYTKRLKVSAVPVRLLCMIEASPTEDQQLQQQQQQQLTTRFAQTNIHQSFPTMEVRSLPAKRSILPEAPTSRRKATAADRKRASENSATTIIDVQQGFGNEFETEALPNALPRGKNNPLRCPYGLYAEQISGTMFITERSMLKDLHLLLPFSFLFPPSSAFYTLFFSCSPFYKVPT